jgi:hypothetical protein
MIDHGQLLQAGIKAARKALVMEPTREGKREWLQLISRLKKEAYDYYKKN